MAEENNEISEVGAPIVLNKIPEIVVKRRKNLQNLRERREREGSNKPMQRAAKKTSTFVRAEQLVKKHRLSVKDESRVRRTVKIQKKDAKKKRVKLAEKKDENNKEKVTTTKEKTVKKKKASGVLVVIRIRDMKSACQTTKRELNILGLKNLYSAVIVPNTLQIRKQLERISPFITYGTPSHKLLRELIIKRGHAKIQKERLPLSDNKLVEDHLGGYGIVCVEDIIHEIESIGKNMKYALKFLWPFKLSNPVKPFPKQAVAFKKGGDCGDRGVEINALLQSMN